jgi:hypothetical protein
MDPPFAADSLKPIVLQKVGFSVAKFVAPENFSSEVAADFESPNSKI